MKKGARKYVAAALAIAGVAGLSLAAASTLNVTTSKEVAIGSGTFAPCDTNGVKVSYDYAKTSGAYNVKTVTVSDIATECAGEKILLSVANAGGTELVNTTGVVAGTTFTYTVTTPVIPVSTDLGDATVIISG